MKDDPHPQTLSASEPELRGALHVRRLSGNAALDIGSALFANSFSYVFHFVLSRKLGPEQYGTLATMMAIAAMLGVIGASVGTVAMQETARMWGSRLDRLIPDFFRRSGRAVFGLSLIVALSLGLLSIPLKGYLHIDIVWLWWLLASYVGISLFSAFARGAAQGTHRFSVYAWSISVEGIGKVVLALSFVALGLGVGGALGGLVCSALLGLGVVFFPLAFGGQRDHASTPSTGLGGRALKVLAVSSATSALLYIDMLFAKHHFIAKEVGYFGAAGTIARMIPYGAGLVMPILAPLAAAAKHSSRASLRQILLLVGLSALGAIALGMTLISLFPDALIHVMYGASYTSAAPILPLYGIDESLFSACLLGVSYLLAINDYKAFGFVTAAVVLEAGFMAAFAATPVRLLSIAIAVNALLVPIVWILAVRSLSVTSPSREEEHPAGA